MLKISHQKYQKIVKIVFTLITLILSVATAVVFAQNVRHVVWKKIPLSIQIPIGQEKIISFPTTVQPFLPHDLLNKGALKSINNDGTLYLMATTSFSNQLAEIKLNNTHGDVILLNLSASKTANQDQLSILLPPSSEKQPANASQPTGDSQKEDQSLGGMVRWVAQQLYAPKRLLTRPNWIFRTPMQTERFVSLYRGAVVSAMPLASWRSGDYYITAVLLRNVQRNQRVVLRHKMIRGSWIAISFFRLSHLNPSVLTAARTATDSTTAIMISSVPFNEALKEGYNNV